MKKKNSRYYILRGKVATSMIICVENIETDIYLNIENSKNIFVNKKLTQYWEILLETDKLEEAVEHLTLERL